MEDEPTTPPDEARASDDWGTTADEQRRGEPLEQQLTEETRYGEPAGRPRGGRLLDDGSEDTEDELVAEASTEDEDADLSAEEAALRIDPSPGGLTDHPDDYVEDDVTPE
jgi:hypothetical protein